MLHRGDFKMSTETFPNRHEGRESDPAENVESRNEQDFSREKSLVHKHEKPVDIEQIRLSIEQEAKSSEEAINDHNPKQEKKSISEPFIRREALDMAFQRILTRTRKQLPVYERVMSRIIHQPAVDAASEAVGRTVARPSGILGGGTIAFLGTLTYYFIARHYGYSYNFFVYLALVVVGFGLGWAIELAWKLLRLSKKAG